MKIQILVMNANGLLVKIVKDEQMNKLHMAGRICNNTNQESIMVPQQRNKIRHQRNSDRIVSAENIPIQRKWSSCHPTVFIIHDRSKPGRIHQHVFSIKDREREPVHSASNHHPIWDTKTHSRHKKSHQSQPQMDDWQNTRSRVLENIWEEQTGERLQERESSSNSNYRMLWELQAQQKHKSPPTNPGHVNIFDKDVQQQPQRSNQNNRKQLWGTTHRKNDKKHE